MKIPYLSFKKMHQELRDQLLVAFENFYDDGWYVSGPRVENFEKEYANFNGVGFAVGVSNGFDALQLALKSLDIGMGDEVIAPSNTYIASILSITHAGAIPILVEPDPHTYNIKANNILPAVSKKTKAIMPVHLYGQACEMDEILKIAQLNNLSVIEDNAQAHGASYNGKMTGSFGTINATSFYPGKNLGALGESGALTTNDHTLATKAKILRNYGSEKKYFNQLQGYNMRMDECQAAFLSIKLKHLDRWTSERVRISEIYHKNLQNCGDIILPVTAINAAHVYHIYMIRTQKRDALRQYLDNAGIETMIHYPIPVHRQIAYHAMNFYRDHFPIAEEISSTGLSLPIWPGISEQEINYICDLISKFFKLSVNK